MKLAYDEGYHSYAPGVLLTQWSSSTASLQRYPPLRLSGRGGAVQDAVDRRFRGAAASGTVRPGDAVNDRGVGPSLPLEYPGGDEMKGAARGPGADRHLQPDASLAVRRSPCQEQAEPIFHAGRRRTHVRHRPLVSPAAAK